MKKVIKSVEVCGFFLRFCLRSLWVMMGWVMFFQGLLILCLLILLCSLFYRVLLFRTLTPVHCLEMFRKCRNSQKATRNPGEGVLPACRDLAAGQWEIVGSVWF